MNLERPIAALQEALARQEDAEHAVRAAEWDYRTLLESVRQDMENDPRVQAARYQLECEQARYGRLMDLAKKRGLVAFEADRQKTRTIDGWVIRVRETTKRTITNAVVCFKAAEDAGLHGRVFKAMRLTRNTKPFNDWVDLMDPPGVDVDHSVSVSVTPPKEAP